MPRSPRFDLAYVPQHVVQRGHDGSACFHTASDYRYYLDQLLRASRRWECDVHAYVLMRDHLHLLVTASHAGAVGNMMQSIGRNYVGYFNTLHRRSGPLWEGRYRSCLVDADYLLACQRYIELNPVRSGIVGEPSTYPWSSYGCNALGTCDPLVVPQLAYMELGNYPEQRMRAYRQLFTVDIDPAVLRDIRMYIQQQRALGSATFQGWVKTMLGRYAATRPAHRPRKQLNTAV